MKVRKKRNIGFLAFLIAVLIVVIYCAVCAFNDKAELNEICELCEQTLGYKDLTAKDFSQVAFYKNEFRGRLYDGNAIIAEKKDGKWTVVSYGLDDFRNLLGGIYK